MSPLERIMLDMHDAISNIENAAAYVTDEDPTCIQYSNKYAIRKSLDKIAIHLEQTYENLSRLIGIDPAHDPRF